jgi:DNA-binding beta-propeller fold protein YncE
MMQILRRLGFSRNLKYLLFALGIPLYPLTLISAPLNPGEPIAVPGTKGGFDFLEIDQQFHRLLADHTGNKSLDVFNLPDGKFIKSIATGAAQGVAVDASHNSYYVTVSDQKKLVEIDRRGLEVSGSIDLPGPPDALTYYPKTGKVYVDHDNGEDVWVIDPADQKIVATITIPTAPEYILFDPAFEELFQNIKSKPAMVVIDPTTNSIAETWSTLPAEKPHGLVIDPKTRRLFSAGGNGKLVVMDCTTGVCLTSVDIAPGVDQIAFDPGNQRIYCASGQGRLSVLEETVEGAKSLGDVETSKGAHTLAVDPDTHSVWIAFPKDAACYIQELKSVSSP